MVAFYKMMGLCSRFPQHRSFGHYYMGYLPWDKPAKIEVVSGAFCMIRRHAGGMEVAKNFILPFITEGKHAEADYKTRLQEIVQQNPEEKLSYVVEQETGPDHNKHFVVAVRFNSDCVARGEGRSKKMAEQHAAREALKLLGVIKEK